MAVRKVCPPIEELEQALSVKTNIPCSIDGCGRTLPQPSALRMHMIKVHRIFQDEDDRSTYHGQRKYKAESGETLHFHCPVEKCVYSIDSDRRFTSMKYLKQHYIRVHGDRKYKCEKEGCGMAFAMERDLRRHHKHCGKTYTCGDCSCPYSTREGLLTHCRRTGHPVPAEYSCTTVQDKVQPQQKKSPDSSREGRYLLPKPSAVYVPVSVGQNGMTSPLSGPIVMVVDSGGGNLSESPIVFKSLAPKSEPRHAVVQYTTVKVTPEKVAVVQENLAPTRNMDTQTEADHTKSTTVAVEALLATPRVQQSPCGTLSSIGTQIAPPQRTQITAQTQTSGDYILKKAMQDANIPIRKESKAAQVSPRAIEKRAYVMQHNETQTHTPKIPKKRRRKKLDLRASEVCTQTSVPEKVSEMPQERSIGTDPDPIISLPLQDMSETETQTIALLDELESLAETISTQTLESFLMDSQGNGSLQNRFSAEMDAPGWSADNLTCTTPTAVQHSIETQTADLFFGNLDPLSYLSDPSSCQTPSDTYMEGDDISKDLRCASELPLSSTGLVQVSAHGENDGMTSQLQVEKEIHSRQENTQTQLMDGCCSASAVPQICGKQTEMSTSSALRKDTEKPEEINRLTERHMQTDTLESGNHSTEVPSSGQIVDSAHLSLQAPDGIGIQTEPFSSDAFSTASSSGAQTSESAEISIQPPDGTVVQARTDQPHSHGSVHAETTTDGLNDFPLLTLTSAGAQTSDFDTLYMNMHTQTVDSMVEQLLSNMETQTNEDFFPDFGFSNIETQTTNLPSNPSLDSTDVEIQTNLHSLAPASSTIESIDTETQTLFPSFDFDNPGLTDSHTQTTWQDLETLMKSWEKN